MSSRPDEFARSRTQDRLDEISLGMADLRTGSRSWTSAAVSAARGKRLTGGWRVAWAGRACKHRPAATGDLPATETSREQYVRLSKWVEADGCADLPFQNETFDRVLCIEAIFHFPSRLRFFREVLWGASREGLGSSFPI